MFRRLPIRRLWRRWRKLIRFARNFDDQSLFASGDYVYAAHAIRRGIDRIGDLTKALASRKELFPRVRELRESRVAGLFNPLNHVRLP